MITASAPDGRKVKYTFKIYRGRLGHETNHYRLRLIKAERPSGPTEDYTYEEPTADYLERIIRKDRPQGRFLEIEYHKSKAEAEKDKVKYLRAPAGNSNHAEILYRFEYKDQGNRKKPFGEGQTRVFDALNHQTIYKYSLHTSRLNCIQKFLGTSAYQLYSQESLYWGDENSNEEAQIVARTIQDGHGQIAFCRHYAYDAFGNILADTLYGNITGKNSTPILMRGSRPQNNGCEAYTVQHSYSKDGLNLLVETTEGNVTTKYVYLPNTNLLAAKYLLCDGQIKIREFFEYDDNAALRLHIIDDGSSYERMNLGHVTERKFKKITNTSKIPAGLPETIEEYALDLKTITRVFTGKTFNHIGLWGRVRRSDHYDSQQALVGSEHWSYNEAGQVTQYTNALGQITEYQYDVNGNKIYEKGPSSSSCKKYDYDRSNRLIREDEYANNERFSKTYCYDLMGNRIASMDNFGSESRLEYDAFGRVVKLIQPAVPDEQGHLVHPVTTYQYDLFGNVSVTIDPKGNQTKTKYTITGKPYWKEYPDGSIEKWEYNIKGELKKLIAKDGSYTVYDYDFLSRPTKIETFNAAGELLKTSFKEYSAFHLLREIEPNGRIISYSYDLAGRLVAKQEGSKKTEWFYDSRGRIEEEREYYNEKEYIATKRGYDILNRLTEETVYDAAGVLCSKSQYIYDERGNRSHELTFTGTAVSEQITLYNFRNEPIETIDPLGNKTRFRYSYTGVRSVEKIDPQGQVEITTYDSLGRISKVVRKNPFDTTTKQSEYRYDLAGNRVSHIETVKAPQVNDRQVVTLWEYDSMHRVTLLLEAAATPEQKSTRYRYTVNGNLECVAKSDGIEIHSTYDPLGRLSLYRASDDSFHYAYTYDAGSNPISVMDRNSGLATLRQYDLDGNLLSETFSHGLAIDYDYDHFGRPTRIRFPDSSAVTYEYQGPHLHKIKRLDAYGQEHYEHLYEVYDLCGNVTCSKLAGQAGSLLREYDLQGRPTSTTASRWKETIDKRDPCGNLIEKTLLDSGGVYSSSYAYDDLYQIAEEKGDVSHLYLHDSLHNRLVKDGENNHINSLNQLLADAETTYTYDLRGNRIRKLFQGQATDYGYDAQDRLISITTEGSKAVYDYDAYNRRIAKTLYRADESGWKKIETTQFLYLNNSEIAACDSENHLFELRILGKAFGGELGASVALELHGNVYVPIHDHLGHVSCLLDLNGNVTESYRYGAFGEESIYDASGNRMDASLNPWRYCGKRHDPESGLIYFGLRYYDPLTATWTSPDPLGYEGGPNLYAFVLNNPFIYCDLQGLFALPSWNALLNFPVPSFYSLYTYSGTKEALYFHEKALMNPLPENTIRVDEEFKKSKFNPGATTGSVGSYQLPDKWITHVNGINTPPYENTGNLLKLSGYAGGHLINFTYSRTNGFCYDVHRNLLCRMHNYETDVVKALHAEWDRAFAFLPPGATILHTCHSDGAPQTRNALLSYPPELRKRIEVVAICPSCYISEEICARVMHICSKNDFVHLLDRNGRNMALEQNTVVEVGHPNAPFFDHSISSETLADAIRMEYNHYLQK